MDTKISVVTVLPVVSSLFVMALGLFCYRRRALEQKTEQQLRMSRDNLNFALQSGQMGTWDVDLATSTVACSQEMLNIWGVSQEEYKNQRSVLQSKVHPEDFEAMISAINHAIDTDVIYELEYRIYPQPGQLKWVFARGRCLYEPGSRKPVRFSGVVFDITDRKAREEALTQAVRVRDQFLTIAGHELKTPLTNMQMQIQLRLRDLKRNNREAFTPEKTAENLSEQYEYVRRMSLLVDDMLDTSQISEGHLRLSLEKFDLYQMVKETSTPFSSVQVLAESSQSIHGTWDRFRLQQVLVNLLTNAEKYGNKKSVQVAVRQEGNNALISVQDHGVGISPQDRERIFRRYERAISENEVCGFGLGLYIANSIVQLHGGQIQLESELGQGSTFTVILPLERGLV